MVIKYAIPRSDFDAYSVLQVTEQVTNSIAEAAVTNAIETAIDMVEDCPADYPNKDAVESVINVDPTSVTEFVEDVLDDLKEAVLKRIATMKVDARVTALRYHSEDGRLIDVDCVVKFK